MDMELVFFINAIDICVNHRDKPLMCLAHSFPTFFVSYIYKKINKIK